jgi:predicted nucleic acid-binding protein
VSGPLAVDTSVGVPLLVQTHRGHRAVTRWAAGRSLALSGHAAAETYSVLTRLPADARVAPEDAAHLIRERFARPYLLDLETGSRLTDVLGGLGIAGGAVYDALVGMAAVHHGTDLATRDARALATYRAVGVGVQLVG